MDKLIQLVLGNHQSSSLVGYAIGLFALFNQAREAGAVNVRDAIIVTAIVFGFRFLNDRAPDIGAIAGKLLNAQQGQAIIARQAQPPSAGYAPLDRSTIDSAPHPLVAGYETALRQAQDTNARLRERVAALTQNVEALNAKTQAGVDDVRNQPDADLLRRG